MQQDELRQLIRDAIARELGPDAGRRLLASEPREEIVFIGSDDELSNFVRRLLDMVDDPKTREDIHTGRLKFKLAGEARHQRSEVTQVRRAQQMAQPFVTEKQVDALPEGTAVITVGKRTRLTPLARDRLKSKKIKIERTDR